MRYVLISESGCELGFWHSQCQIGQVIDTNRGRVQIVDIDHCGNFVYYTTQRIK